MKKILIYGNCQTNIINKAFIKTKLTDEYEISYINCYVDERNNIESIDISEFDIIITQPIYQQTDPKTTIGVLKKKKKDCIVIIVHSFVFNFYFPNLIHLDEKVNKLNLPIVYHDKNLLSLYLKYGEDKKSIFNNYKEIVLSDRFYSEESYLKNYQNSINELKRRFLQHSDLYKDFSPIYFLPITDFIEKNYQDNLLWHSNTHPSYNHVLKPVCYEILSIINRDIELPNYVHDASYARYSNQLPLYQSISSLVNFDTIKHISATINKKQVIIQDFVEIFLKVYRNTENVKDLKYH